MSSAIREVIEFNRAVAQRSRLRQSHGNFMEPVRPRGLRTAHFANVSTATPRGRPRNARRLRTPAGMSMRHVLQILHDSLRPANHFRPW